MTALILAAGRGTRLRRTTDRPKCLLEIGGRSLLDRMLSAVDGHGSRCRLVVGYRHDLVEAHLQALGRQDVETVLNPEFEQGSSVSLSRGLEGLRDELLLMDGDVLCHPTLVARLLEPRMPNALLVDTDSVFRDEEYMAGLTGDRVTALRRGALEGYDVTGEWVGLTRLGVDAAAALRVAVRERVASGDSRAGYEAVLGELLESLDLRGVPTTGLPWVEIDFPEDVTAAERLLSRFEVKPG